MKPDKHMKSVTAIRWMFTLVHKYKGWFFVSLLTLASLVVINLMKAYFIQEFINSSLQGSIRQIVTLVIGFIVITLSGGVFSYFTKYATSKFSLLAIRDLKNQLADHMSKVTLKSMSEVQSGDLAARLHHDTEAISNFIKNDLPNFTLQVLTSLCAAGYVLFVSWKMLLVSLLFTPIGMYIAYQLNKNARKFYPESLQAFGQAAGEVEQTIQGIDTVKSYNLHGLLGNKLKDRFERVFNAEMKVQKYVSFLQPVCFALSWFPRMVCVVYGGFMAMNGELSAGTVVLCLQLFEYIVAPTVYAPFMMNTVNRAMASMERVSEVFAYPRERSTGERINVSMNEVPIRFHQVSFGYDEANPLFSNLNLDIPHSQMTALVGASGSGKSTIINLICGLYEQDAGEVAIFGTDVKKLQLSSIREQMTVVLQDPYLFPATIAENIKYGSPHATLEEVIVAAKAAHAHEFIDKMPDGYHTMVGDGGTDLSGGQLQRISIARAFLKNSPILILDEPTASLDNYSETLIQQSLEKLMEGRTVFVVAHRLSTVVKANQIFVLHQGQIAEVGTHHELVEKRGFYYRLYYNQLSA